jgi:hypothetical protein
MVIMAEQQSKRARILRRVLDYINAGSWWAEKNGLLMFGDKERVESCIACAAPAQEVSNDAVRDAQAIRSRIVASRGRRAAARRVTVGKLPPEPTPSEIEGWLLGLAPERREEVVKYIGQSLSVRRIDPDTNTSISREDDSLDAALAVDMLDQLEKSFSQIKGYRALRVKHASPWIQQYFEEAHRCYIFGLETACAVLCRGLLEAVLTDLVDPTCSLTRKASTGQSHLSAMIDEARNTLLRGKKAQSAEMIRDAGNCAIHDLKTFREKYAPLLGSILEDTRKLLADLYK